MTTITPNPDVLLPPGADDRPELANDWQPDLDDRPYRCVWTPGVEPETYIRGVVIQYSDGTIGAEGDDTPLVYIGADDYPTDKARGIAQKILEVADVVDGWAGRPADVDVAAELEVARAALESACQTLRLAPGNAGCWAKAALDAVIEAKAVLR